MKGLYSILLLFAGGIVFGQSPSVSIGPTLDPKEIISLMELSKFRPTRLEATLPAGQFFHNATKKTFTHFGFSTSKLQFMVSENYTKPKGNAQLTAEFIAAGEKERVSVVSMLNVGEKLFIIYIMAYSETDEFSVYVNEVTDDLVLMGSPVLLRNYKNVKKQGASVVFKSSQDEKYFLLYHAIEGRAKEPIQFECSLLDRSFSEIWFKPFKLSYLNEDLSIDQLNIDNAGNLYMLCSKEEEPSTGPVLIFYGWQSQLFKIGRPGLRSGSNYGARIEIANGVRPYVIGLNRDKKTVNYFVDEVDLVTGSMVNLGKGTMPEEFYLASKGLYSVDRWSVTNLIALTTGQLVASIEARFLKVTSSGNVLGTYAFHTFVMGFQANGVLAYDHVVRKSQVGDGDYVGHALLPFGDKVLVLYNDNSNNLSKKPNDKNVEIFNGKKGVMAVVQQIDSKGNVTKYRLSKDAAMIEHAVNIRQLEKLDENRYYATTLLQKNAFNFLTREILITLE